MRGVVCYDTVSSAWDLELASKCEYKMVEWIECFFCLQIKSAGRSAKVAVIDCCSSRSMSLKYFSAGCGAVLSSQLLNNLQVVCKISYQGYEAGTQISGWLSLQPSKNWVMKPELKFQVGYRCSHQKIA